MSQPIQVCDLDKYVLDKYQMLPRQTFHLTLVPSIKRSMAQCSFIYCEF